MKPVKQKRLWLPCVLFLILSLSCLSTFGEKDYQKGGNIETFNGEPIKYNQEWMKNIQDTLPICKLSIPGTHDSGAIGGGSLLQTQSSTLSEQLQQGIRAFDIRLKEKEGRLGVFHGSAFQGIYWETEVLPTFIDFLKDHPSETLIVSLKKEGGELQDYASLLSTSLDKPAYAPYFIINFFRELTLKDCRGKILFLHRDRAMESYPGVACLGWEDNSTTELTLRNNRGEDSFAQLQDEYQYESDSDGEAEKKIKTCVRHFDQVLDEADSSWRWGISFISATAYPSGTPLVLARKINRFFGDWFRREKKRNYGVVFIDFVGDREGRNVVQHLIKSNFY